MQGQVSGGQLGPAAQDDDKPAACPKRILGIAAKDAVFKSLFPSFAEPGGADEEEALSLSRTPASASGPGLADDGLNAGLQKPDIARKHATESDRLQKVTRPAFRPPS